MTTAIVLPLAPSTAARLAAVDALALLAAIVLAVSVVGILVASVLSDRSSPRPYRFATESTRRGTRPVMDEKVRDAA